MHGKSDTAVRGGGARVATKEQLRVAQATQDGQGQDEDRSRVQKMIKEITEMTRCSQAQAEIALHDANNNVELAVNNILESSELDVWSHYKRKGPKTKEEEREEAIKKSGNRPARRNNQGQRDSKGPRNNENGNEGHENRQPREPRETREPRDKEEGFRSGRPQQNRTRREPGGKRDNKKVNGGETKDESEDYWKNGPLVFNRRDNIDEKEQQKTGEPVKAQPTAAGPLSFADVVRKNAQKPQPQVQPPTDSQFKLQVSNDARQSQSPHSLANADGLDENIGYSQALPETSKSPRQPVHLEEESSSNLLHDDSVTFGAQPSSQKLQQSLTDQLKNDLGLGQTPNNNSFVASPPKKYQEPVHQQNKAPVVKAGVVEFLSGDAVSSGDWQFGFEAAPAPQQNLVEEHQFRREPVSKISEPSRNEMGLPSSAINESNQPRGNASTVLNQYVQQQQAQQNSQPPHLSYGHQTGFNRNRNGLNNLPFSNNYSDNFNSDLRSSYGAPSSPPKSNVQQPLQNLASQQQQQLQSQQAHHHMFPNQLPYANYPYVNMYSPVAPLRDDLPNTLLPFQYNLNHQFGLDALTMIPQLANVTSAGPLPTGGHQSQHHQAHPQQQSVQQGLQHNQNSQTQQNHQRNEHYNDLKYLSNQMSIPPSSQNNGSNGHNQQQNSNLGNQQRQQILDNNSQGSIAGVAPPPGFTPNNIAAAPFLSQPRNINSMNSMFPPSFQMPFQYVLPNSVQHKSK